MLSQTKYHCGEAMQNEKMFPPAFSVSEGNEVKELPSSRPSWFLRIFCHLSFFIARITYAL